MLESCYCGKINFKTITAKDFLYGALNTYEYNVCINCNSFYLKDIVSEVNYNENYYSLKLSRVNRLKSILRIIRYKSLFGDLINILKPISLYNKIVIDFLKSKKSVPLDHGSGNSNYIDFLKRLKFINRGYSYDPYAKDRLTFKSLSNIPFEEINLVISNQSIEHVKDPLNELNKMYDLTLNKCEMIFSVPVSGSVLNFFKQYSFTLQAPDHVTILSLSTWKILISKTKWKINSISEDHNSQKFYLEESFKILNNNNKTLNKKLNLNLNPVDNIVFHLKK